MDRAKMNAVKKDILAALTEIGEKHGITFDITDIRFSRTTIDIKIGGAEGEEDKNYRQIQFENICKFYGFKPEDFGLRFIAQRREFELIGFNPSAKKNVCQIRDVNSNKEFVCAPEFIKRGA